MTTSFSLACRAAVKRLLNCVSTGGCWCATRATGSYRNPTRLEGVRVRGRRPLVSLRAQGMIVMPNAPHGLFNRAVVLADHEGQQSAGSASIGKQRVRDATGPFGLMARRAPGRVAARREPRLSRD